jgi:hypothetical protein
MISRVKVFAILLLLGLPGRVSQELGTIGRICISFISFSKEFAFANVAIHFTAFQVTLTLVCAQFLQEVKIKESDSKKASHKRKKLQHVHPTYPTNPVAGLGLDTSEDHSNGQIALKDGHIQMTCGCSAQHWVLLAVVFCLHIDMISTTFAPDIAT